jgi:hypothetical protein
MTSAWKAAFRYSADLADKMGLELGIAASAGWSETGGPWVKPQDAMKKLVWSEAIIVGGARFNDVLPPPPTTTGPVAPSGALYRVLYLSGTSERMTLSMLHRIAALAENGGHYRWRCAEQLSSSQR